MTRRTAGESAPSDEIQHSRTRARSACADHDPVRRHTGAQHAEAAHKPDAGARAICLAISLKAQVAEDLGVKRSETLRPSSDGKAEEHEWDCDQVTEHFGRRKQHPAHIPVSRVAPVAPDWTTSGSLADCTARPPPRVLLWPGTEQCERLPVAGYPRAVLVGV